MRAAAVVLAVLAGGAATPPAPVRWVTDDAAFLSPATRDALDTRLEGYQRATGHQVVVWIGRTLDGAPLDDWSVRAFAAWKVGRKGLDDGIAMFVFADDRAIDIEVGYGLEDRVPDAIAARIIGEVMTPRLRAGDRDGAVTTGADAILAAIEGKPWTGPAAGQTPRPSNSDIVQVIVGLLALVAFVVLLATRPGLALMLLWTITGSSRRDGHGGGGFGGFAGGGGRSGGGGARGRW